MCSVCETNPAREYPADTLEAPFGAVAQLVEHLHGMQGVVGSSPISSTDPFGIIQRWWRSVGFTLAGVVAGEGSSPRRPPAGFATARRGLRFRFVIEMAARDRRLLEAFEMFLGVGSIQERCDRRSWLPTCTYAATSIARIAWRRSRSQKRSSSLAASAPSSRAGAPRSTPTSTPIRRAGQGPITLFGPWLREAGARPLPLSQPLLPCHRLLKRSLASSAASWRPRAPSFRRVRRPRFQFAR